ncbi:MAG: hypothetical protein OXG51_15465 [Gammaproteobacteria bacterium]|nr:hypothetical protein [Gammaproteobacteria bacterium]
MSASQSALSERAGRVKVEAAILAAAQAQVDFAAYRRHEIERFRASPMSPFALCLEQRSVIR